MSDWIKPGVHIGSRGCGDRYCHGRATREESRAKSCKCPEGHCWVDYARNQHERGQSAAEPGLFLAMLSTEERGE